MFSVDSKNKGIGLVVPVVFEGTISPLFHLLGRLSLSSSIHLRPEAKEAVTLHMIQIFMPFFSQVAWHVLLESTVAFELGRLFVDANIFPKAEQVGEAVNALVPQAANSHQFVWPSSLLGWAGQSDITTDGASLRLKFFPRHRRIEYGAAGV